jgi:hypothetical protein
MMWLAIFHLACLAVTLELIYRAPEYDAQIDHCLERPKQAVRVETGQR